MRIKRPDIIQTFLEISIVFAIFYLFGSWPIPDSNEPYYIGKAIHYWNPDWIPDDTFLETKDSHWSFYVVFGWLTFFLSPYGMACVGRIATWWLLAWSWRRLSFALIPLRWMSIPTGLALAYYVDAFHLAGEWILGGVEGKSFAFPFVFFGLEAMVRGRWHRTWIFLGIASAFHVLVGGWTVLVAGFVRCFSGSHYVMRKGKVPIPWGLFSGGVIALFGLLPALLLDHGVSGEVVRQAHQIYVFDRLYHHLVPSMLPWTYLARFLLLTAVWVLFCRFATKRNRRAVRFELFVWGTLLLSAVGLVVAYGLRGNRELSAEILRFYWFRLSDVAVPMGVALGSLRGLLKSVRSVRAAPRLPSFFEGIVLLAVPFTLYLLLDHLVFGRWFFSWTVKPEQGIPWALTLIACWGVLRAWPRPVRRWGLVLLFGAVALYAPFGSLATTGDLRTRFSYARTEPGHVQYAYGWTEACRWASDPSNTAKTSKFWVPREGATFKWHAGRSDVGVWKEIPQDAEGIVAWFQTMRDLFSYVDEEGNVRWDRSLTILLWWKTGEEIERLRVKYGFEYILCTRYPELTHHETLKTVYENDYYRIYRVAPP